MSAVTSGTGWLCVTVLNGIPWDGRSLFLHTKIMTWRDFPGCPVVKISPSNARGVGSIPGWGAKIPCALWSKNQNIKQKQYCNKFNKDFKSGPYQEKKSWKKIIIWKISDLFTISHKTILEKKSTLISWDYAIYYFGGCGHKSFNNSKGYKGLLIFWGSDLELWPALGQNGGGWETEMKGRARAVGEMLQGLINFFCKWLDSKYFRLCRSSGICRNHLCKQWVWLCSSKISFTKTGFGPDLVHGCSLPISGSEKQTGLSWSGEHSLLAN